MPAIIPRAQRFNIVQSFRFKVQRLAHARKMMKKALLSCIPGLKSLVFSIDSSISGLES
jgi:hypothetical protein